MFDQGSVGTNGNRVDSGLPLTVLPPLVQFNHALDGARGTTPLTVVPAKDPGGPTGPVAPTAPTTPGQTGQPAPPRITFGPHEPEGGIHVEPLQPGGPWPFQIYRRSPYGLQNQTNDQLHKQLSATPKLDPKPFGNRPAAPADADQQLQPGDEIVVLDETRLEYLEDQRRLRDLVMPSVSTDSQATRRDAQINDLKASIAEEIDYATMGQAVPDFESVAGTIRDRAPNDQIYQQAINQAKVELEARWQSEGRTKDQIGQVLAAGEAGDFAKAGDLAKQQFIAVGEQQGNQAPPEAVSAAILARASVYSTYVTGDPRYSAAIEQAAGDAVDELLVERPIDQVLDKAREGGDNWHNESVKTLREVTDPATHTPEQVLAIMSDPRIKHLVQQVLRHTETLDSPEQGPVWVGWSAEDTALTDLSAIYSVTLYGDDVQSGRGKALVDETAAFIVDHTSYGEPDDYMATRQADTIGLEFSRVFYESAGEGHIALALAVAAKVKGTDHPAFSGFNDPADAAADGLENYRSNVIERLEKKIQEDGAFLTVPLSNVGTHLSKEERMALSDQLLAAYPDKAEQLNQDLIEFNEATTIRRQPMQQAIDAYGPELKGTSGYDNASKELDKIPQPDPQPQPPGFPETNRYWLDRSARLTASYIIRQSMHLPALGNFDRSSRAYSAYLFAANAASLMNGEFIDRLYVAPHSAMAVSEGAKAVLPEKWQVKLFGADQLGKPMSPFALNRLNERALARIEASNLDNGMKLLLKQASAGLFLSPLDAAYVVVDGYNSYSYFTGNTDKGEVDVARGFAFAISTGGDVAFLFAAGAEFTGATVLGLSATAWTGVGAVLLLTAAGINFVKGMHDAAHKFDAENTKAWELLGIQDPEVAKALAQGMTFADKDSNKNAGQFLVDVFHHAGYSTQEMIDFINTNWSKDNRADEIATFIKNAVDKGDPEDAFTEVDYARVERYAEANEIPFPDYYNDSNTPPELLDPYSGTVQWSGP